MPTIKHYGVPLAKKRENWERFLGTFHPVPEEWKKGAGVASEEGDEVPTTEVMPCESWEELVGYWKKAVCWTEGMDTALAVCLACASSTMLTGDQLWIKLIGPASCGKSTLCEALTVSTRFVVAKSKLRGFHSGFVAQEDKKATQKADHSLIPEIRNKTLITKDGDTLLSSPNLSEILSEARDLYDGVSRSHYRNSAGRAYAGLRMTWILAGTASLRSIDSSELGERFLDCVVVDKLEDGQRESIAKRVRQRAFGARVIETDEEDENRQKTQDEEMLEAHGRTAGYLEYLRENVAERIEELKVPTEAEEGCERMGDFVAYMRARPSKLQSESKEREMPWRLIVQLARLAMNLSVVLNRPEIDDVVMEKVKKVALDTARGHTLDICRQLVKVGDLGMEAKGLATIANLSEPKANDYLLFLSHIGVVERTKNVKRKKGFQSRGVRWKLTHAVKHLMEHIE